MYTKKGFRLGRAKMLSFLDELVAPNGTAVSLYLPRDTDPETSKELLLHTIDPDTTPQDLNELIAGSHTGAVLFWSGPQKCLVVPPFPIQQEHVAGGYHIEPLRSLLSHDYTIALVLVRLGSYSIGVCRGTTLLESKTGTGVVHARHKKGGSSQGRFARHREKQIECFLDRVCTHARARIEPYSRQLDYLVYGGARSTITSLRKRCTFLCGFDDRILRMLLEIPDPRRAVLEQALRDVWSTTVIQWSEDAA